MTLIDWANRNLLTAITSTEGLIQIFIVILFFENYLIVIDKKSILGESIEFDKIRIAPIVFFFLFIAISRVIWNIVFFLKAKFFYSKDATKIKAHTSFITFTLSMLIGGYMINFLGINPNLSPINQVKHNFLFYMFTLFCGFSMLGCFIVFLSSDIKIED